MGNYLKLFENHAQYEEYTANTGNIIPAVSHCIEEEELHFDEKIDYSKQYLTFVVNADGSLKFSGSTTANTVSYSKDEGQTWTTANSATVISVTTGDKIMWKGSCSPQSSKGIGKFSGSTDVKYDVEGNAMSLLFNDNFNGLKNLTGKEFAFYGLFSGDTNIVNSENLSLPATTLTDSCYMSMFRGCTSLATAPELPATILSKYCYSSMFVGCTSLTTAPELPATTLANNCYWSMFSGCTSLATAPELSVTTLAKDCYYGMFFKCTNLTTAPELPATTLASGCYSNMFAGCTSLATAPELPATTLASDCYSSMFNGCTSITIAPELPVTTLADSCYYSMFSNCTSLTTAPELPATTLVNGCYTYMFSNCTSLTTAPELPATTLESFCYREMFRGCTNINYIKCLATNVSAYSCTTDWVNGVAASGTFKKAASMTSWTTDANGIPTGWTVQDA